MTAWGEIGHRTVAYLARMYFTEDAEALFQELVKPTDTFDISDGAVWPDNRRVQGKRPWSKPWHYIDAKDEPPKKCRVNYNSDCNEEKGCVVSAIANLVRTRISEWPPFLSLHPPSAKTRPYRAI